MDEAFSTDAPPTSADHNTHDSNQNQYSSLFLKLMIASNELVVVVVLVSCPSLLLHHDPCMKLKETRQAPAAKPQNISISHDQIMPQLTVLSGQLVLGTIGLMLVSARSFT